MGVDKGYGSGKPRSAANSASRRTRAASAGLRQENIRRVASRPFQKARVAAVGGPQYLEVGISAGLKSLYALGKLAPRDIGKSIVEAAAAGNRVRAYNEGVRARSTYSSAAKLAKMTGPKAPQAAKEVREWADARKANGQALRDLSRKLAR
jgi:hypothetical protein